VSICWNSQNQILVVCCCHETGPKPVLLHNIIQYCNKPHKKNPKRVDGKHTWAWGTRIYDLNIRQSCRIRGVIGNTTCTIRHVVFFIYTTYDIIRFYASVVLQVSSRVCDCFIDFLDAKGHIKFNLKNALRGRPKENVDNPWYGPFLFGIWSHVQLIFITESWKCICH
jgi:hypothetical protein